MAKLNAVVWYQMNFNDFNSGEKNYTAIRSTDTAAYIELGRTGASELSADSQPVGLWYIDEASRIDLTGEIAEVVG